MAIKCEFQKENEVLKVPKIGIFPSYIRRTSNLTNDFGLKMAHFGLFLSDCRVIRSKNRL